MTRDEKALKYKQICDKLGYEPRDVRIPDCDTEDDSRVNPFSVLTIDEHDFLNENGYLV